MLPNASWAVTVTLWAVPAVVGLGKAETVKVAAAAGFTVMEPSVPVMVPVTVSVAVMDWVPAVLRVTPLVKVWTPLSPATKV